MGKSSNHEGWAFVNLTPHSITITSSVNELTFPPSGQVAKVSTVEDHHPMGSVAGFSSMSRKLGPVEIPEVPEKTFMIVSSMVLDALPDDHPRLHDFIAPDTGPTAKREKGQVVAVTRWIRR